MFLDCDACGNRYQSKMYCNQWLADNKLVPSSTGSSIDFVSLEDS